MVDLLASIGIAFIYVFLILVLFVLAAALVRNVKAFIKGYKEYKAKKKEAKHD